MDYHLSVGNINKKMKKFKEHLKQPLKEGKSQDIYELVATPKRPMS